MHEQAQFVLTYADIRRFDDRLRAIENGVSKLVMRDAEVVALRAEVATLLEAAKASAEDKAALQARIDAAVTRSQALEDREQAALSNSQPAP